VVDVAAVTSLLLFLSVFAIDKLPLPDAGIDADLAGEDRSVDGGAAVDAVDSDGQSTGAAPAPSPPPAVPVLATGRLHGKVLAKGSRNLPVDAQVTATSATGQVTTIEADGGQFATSLPCGLQALVVRAPGYEPRLLGVDPCVDLHPVAIRLVPRSNLPVYETVVEAPRVEPAITLRGKTLTTTPGALGDPLRTIESLPGVATVAWPAPIYAIRGSNPGNTGYFLDDVQIPMLFHLALGPSLIHPYFFEGIDFYPGGYPSRYGRYVAGVVAAQTRAPQEDSWHAAADLRLFDAGAMVSSPWPDGHGGIAAAFRYSYAGALLSLLQSSLDLAYWDYQLRADRRVGNWTLSLLVLGSSDKLSYDTPSGFPREYFIRFHRGSLRASTSLGGGTLGMRLTASADRSTGPVVQGFPMSVKAYSLFPRLSFERRTSTVDIEVGADGQAQWLRPTVGFSESNASDLGSNRTALLAGAYAATTIRAGRRMTVTPGLRLDRYSISSVSKFDLGPRLSARVLVGDKTCLVASGGRFSQAPSLPLQVPGAENFGLARYGLQTSWQGALGVIAQPASSLHLEVTGYVQRFVLTDLRDPTLTAHDPLATDFLVRRDGRSYGLEVMLRRPENERLYGWLSYTLSKSERVVGRGVVGPSDWDQRHVLNTVAGYRIGNYTLGARFHVNTGRPVLLQSSRSASFVRLPTFYQLDLRAERKFLFDTVTLHVYAEIVNGSMMRTTISVEQNPVTYEVSENSYRIVLPSLGIRGEL
jgi:hypothetical protein